MLDQNNQSTPKTTALASFEQALRDTPDLRSSLKSGLIGANTEIPGPFGPKKLVYADYVASGRALEHVEDFIQQNVLPFYANSHTEASYCGGHMTRMREEARQIILQNCGGKSEDHAVIFAGSGATLALNKLVHLFGVREALANGDPVHILVGPYEHHSNLLPWRESGAIVIEIAEGAAGGPDPEHLRSVLQDIPGDAPVIAAFSAASNVTGIGTDVAAITGIVKQAGGKIVWDYAGGGPYLPIDLSPDNTEIDAIVLSPHKFLGGPGASGVLIVRRDAVTNRLPSFPGGGTVAFVNAQTHDYLSRIEDREEGGTPNIVGDIRAALVMIIKDALGQDFITERNAELSQRTVAKWQDDPNITLLGGPRTDRLPIFSFIMPGNPDHLFDFQLFTRALSDRYGIQARGGCACAGPYVHRLLNIDHDQSDKLRAEIMSGNETHKPGFVRLNFSVLMPDEEVDFILNAITELARDFECTKALYAEPTP